MPCTFYPLAIPRASTPVTLSWIELACMVLCMMSFWWYMIWKPWMMLR